MLPRKESVVIGISSGSSGNGGGASGGVGDGTSGCGSKILSWGGKCGLGAIAGVRACQCNLGPRAGGCGVSVGVGERGLGAGGLVGADWGRRSVTGWLGLALVFFWGSARCWWWGVRSPFFGAFLLVLAKFLFWRGGWALGYHSMAFKHFPHIS